jgi:hypothetical protein
MVECIAAAFAEALAEGDTIDAVAPPISIDDVKDDAWNCPKSSRGRGKDATSGGGPRDDDDGHSGSCISASAAAWVVSKGHLRRAPRSGRLTVLRNNIADR